MKLSIDLGRWTTTKAALAVAGLLAIGGAVGSALAIGPTVPAPVKWQGGWEFTIGRNSGPTHIYTVPAGRNLLLTDLVVGNDGVSSVFFNLYTGQSANCVAKAMARAQGIMVPAGGSIVVDLTTGIGFGSGQFVCFEAGNLVSVTARGFLFTPQPVS